jgi:Peptidase M15
VIRRGLCLLALVVLAGCASRAPEAPEDSRVPAAFERWRADNAETVADFERFLRAESLRGVVPLHELLRSASSWQDCRAEPFAVPPQAQWPDVAAVMRVLQELRAERVLDVFEVHSGYRDPLLNACAGGATRSAHLRRFAVDLTPRARPAVMAELCQFWRSRGRERDMGLGQYPSGRIHIDTMGHRSWGADGSLRSSPCTAAEAR